MSFQMMTEETPEEVEEMPEDGVYVHGFYMDGARFNREEAVIDDQNPVSDPYLANVTLLERAVQLDAYHLVQACCGLRAQRRRICLPLLQDGQARWTALYYRSVHQLHHPRGRPVECEPRCVDQKGSRHALSA
jgi:hypothetical protein